MDCRNRLWKLLVFPWCVSSFLDLRLVCRSFRTFLCECVPSVWLPFTLRIERLNYSERCAGWQGVLRAIESEKETVEGVQTGTNRILCESAAVIEHDVMYLVGNCIVSLNTERADLYDKNTFERLFSCTTPVDTLSWVLCDRWLLFQPTCDRVFALDCVDVRTVELDLPDTDKTGYSKFCISGRRAALVVADEDGLSYSVSIYQTDGQVMMRCKSFNVDERPVFALCERGGVICDCVKTY